MPSFSERYGFKPEKAIQLKSMDDDLRNGLLNVIIEMMNSITYSKSIYLFYYIERDFNKNIVDKSGYDHDIIAFNNFSDSNGHSKRLNYFVNDFLKYKFNEVFDFIEFLLSLFNGKYLDNTKYSIKAFTNSLNNEFAKEKSAYRIIDNQVVPITNDTELQAIQETINETEDKYKAVNDTLLSAIALYSNRKEPNYEKSVACSIDAVESMCKIFTGMEGGTLDDAIKKLGKTHPVLNQAFIKLYGFSCDTVRHGQIKESDIDEPLAKFMLVACSAFINYVIAKEAKE